MVVTGDLSSPFFVESGGELPIVVDVGGSGDLGVWCRDNRDDDVSGATV